MTDEINTLEELAALPPGTVVQFDWNDQECLVAQKGTDLWFLPGGSRGENDESMRAALPGRVLLRPTSSGKGSSDE